MVNMMAKGVGMPIPPPTKTRITGVMMAAAASIRPRMAKPFTGCVIRPRTPG
jgi:hypothetical protein